MNVAELTALLSQYPPDASLTITADFTGAGILLFRTEKMTHWDELWNPANEDKH